MSDPALEQYSVPLKKLCSKFKSKEMFPCYYSDNKELCKLRADCERFIKNCRQRMYQSYTTKKCKKCLEFC